MKQDKNSTNVWEENTVFETERLILKVLDSDFSYITLDYYIRNKDFFNYSLSINDNIFYTLEYQIDKLWKEYNLFINKLAIRYYIFEKNDINYTKIIGDISICNIVYSNYCSCNLGYNIDIHSYGKGYMYEALKKAIYIIFNYLKLHRIEVNILPANIKSINLIKKFNFQEEGIAFNYIKINDIWQNYNRYSLINI